MRLRECVSASVLLIIASLVAGGPARASSWTAPAPISGSEDDYRLQPQILPMQGHLTLAWKRDRTLEACTLGCGPAGQTFVSTLVGATSTPPRALLEPDWDAAQVAATQARLIAAQAPGYTEGASAEVRTGPATGELGPVQTIGPPSVDGQAVVATNRRSAVLAILTRGQGAQPARVFLAKAASAQTFGEARLVYTDRANQILTIVCAMNSRGDALVVWERGTDVNATFEGRFIYASGRLGKVLSFGSGSAWFDRFHVALADDRRAIVSWVDQVLAADGPGSLEAAKLRTAVLTRHARVRRQMLQTYPDTRETNFRATFGRDGRGLAVWMGPKTVRFARLRRGLFRTPTSIGPVGSYRDRLLALAPGPKGRWLAAWSHGPEIRAALIPPKGRPSANELVAPRGEAPAGAFDPVTQDPILAFSLTGDDGITRIAVTERRSP